MAVTTRDTNPNSDPNAISAQPFTWILIPLAVLAAASLLLTCFRYRRRNQLRAMYATSGMDIEAFAASRGIRRTANDPWQWPSAFGPAIRTTGPNGRPTGRRRLGFGLPGFGSREEGLNELGEAPPAYSPQKPEQNVGGEMAGVSALPPAVTSENGTSAAEPPSYGDVAQRNDTEMSRISQPAGLSIPNAAVVRL